MDFSLPVPLTRGLALHLPHQNLIASVHSKTVSIHTLPNLSLLHTFSLPHAPLSLNSTPHPPHTLALTSPNALSLLPVPAPTSPLSSPPHPPVHLSLPHTPVHTTLLTPTTAILLHTLNLGLSLLPLRAPHSLPVFLPSVPTPRLPAPAPPAVASLSPCMRYLAHALKRPDGRAGVRVVALPGGAAVSEAAAGSGRLGGKIAEVAGVRWLRAPVNALLVWGSAVDGEDAMCLLGVDCCLLEMGLPGAGDEGRMLLSGEGGAADLEQVREDLRDAYRDLGVRAVGVGCGGVLAVGGYDGVLKLVNTLTWRRIVSWSLDEPCVDEKRAPTVYVERDGVGEGEENEEGVGNRLGSARRERCFDAVDGLGRVVVMTRKRRDAFGGGETVLKGGVGMLHFSPDGRWLCARSENAANVLFVADVRAVCIVSALVLCEDVQSVAWSAGAGGDGVKLALTTDGECVYFWSEEGAAVVRVPDGLEKESVVQRASSNRNFRGKGRGFRAARVVWGPDDETLLAVDNATDGSYCVVYAN